jgi:D-beta-D-heptose 7-phosphate kinase / D-beta-D-heptose 1-phosphate adenosyltransferase
MKNCFASCSSRTVVVVGDAMLDVYVMGEARRLSPEAPVPIVRVKKQSTTLGGAGNVALNVVGLGCRSVLLGIRGDDAAGQRLSAILGERGVDDSLIADPSRATTTKTRIIGQGQQLLRLDEEETLEGVAPIRERILVRFEEALSVADAVILSDYDKGVLNGSLCAEILGRCGAKGIPVFVDPKGKGWERYRGATCVTPNIAEVQLVAGEKIEDDALLAECARSLRERYRVHWLLVTCGPKGMCLAGPDGFSSFITATAREVYDVSGAGDTVIATLAVGVASGLPIPRAAEIANIAAGIVVGKLGSQAINAKELDAALRIHRTVGRSKVTTLEAAQVQVQAWQAGGEKIIYANGSFDGLSPVHVHVLQKARELGDRLIVGITGDASTARLNGSKRAVLSEQDRAYVLSALKCVDLVVPFQDDTPLSSIEILRPDVVVQTTGSNGSAGDGREIIESYGGRVCIVPHPQGSEGI